MTEIVDQTPFCPTCGRPNEVRQSPDWLLVHFSGIIGGIIALLIECRRQKRTASLKELMEAAYHGRKGFPDTAHMVVQGAISNNREKLQSLGWDIAGPRVTGSGFYLVRTETDRH